jgi:anti-sigma B factor antagonist
MGSAAPFTAQVKSLNGVARIALSGELDLASAPILTEHLTRFEQDGGVTVIMLDLQDLTFIDLSGIHAFLQARDRAKSNGHRLLLVGAPPSARRLFDLTDTGSLLDEETTVALDQLSGSKNRRASAGRDDDPDA